MTVPLAIARAAGGFRERDHYPNAFGIQSAQPGFDMAIADYQDNQQYYPREWNA